MPVALAVTDLVRDPDQLLIAVRDERDRAAFLELFELFAPRITGWLVRGGLAAGVAEETAQEVMLRVWHRCGSWNPGRGNASTWIFAIARNARIDALRKTRLPRWDPEDPALVEDPDANPHRVAVDNQRAASVRRALSSLPEDQAQVIREAYFEQRTLNEIADRAKIPLGTVKSRVRLAMGRLKLALGGEP